MCRLRINPREFNTQKSTNRSFTSNPKGGPPAPLVGAFTKMASAIPSPKSAWENSKVTASRFTLPMAMWCSFCTWVLVKSGKFYWGLISCRKTWHLGRAGPLYSDESLQDWGSSLADYRNSHPWPCVTSMEETWIQAAGMFSLEGSCQLGTHPQLDINILENWTASYTSIEQDTRSILYFYASSLWKVTLKTADTQPVSAFLVVCNHLSSSTVSSRNTMWQWKIHPWFCGTFLVQRDGQLCQLLFFLGVKAHAQNVGTSFWHILELVGPRNL